MVAFNVRRLVGYNRLPVSDLVRGPLLHTPQGIAVVICVLANLNAACIVWLFQLPLPNGRTREVFFVLSLGWSFIVFLVFICHSPSNFRSSWITFYGVLPAIFRVYDGLRA
jgi:hypothetical protein